MQDMPGFIEELPEEEQLQSKKKTSKELEEEEAEKATAQAFKTLALILKQAKAKQQAELRRKEEEDEARQERFIMEDQDKQIIDKNNRKPWLLYPDDKFRSSWDLGMTV